MLSNEHSNFFYSALIFLGAVFAIWNMYIGWKNRRAFRNDTSDDYIALIKENAALKKRIEVMEKLL